MEQAFTEADQRRPLSIFMKWPRLLHHNKTIYYDDPFPNQCPCATLLLLAPLALRSGVFAVNAHLSTQAGVGSDSSLRSSLRLRQRISSSVGSSWVPTCSRLESPTSSVNLVLHTRG